MEIQINVYDILWTAVGLAVLLVLGLYLYFLLYRRHINRALQSEIPGKRWPSPYSMAVWLPVVLGTLVLIFWAVDGFWDVTGRRIQNEEELLEDFATGEYAQWNTEISLTEDMAAVLAWPSDQSDAKISFYRNDTGLTDYVFRFGGKLSSVEKGVLLMEQDGSLLFFTLNQPGIARILCDNGTEYLLDPDRPFALVIPEGGDILVENVGNHIWKCTGYTGIRVFDRNGVEIDLMALEHIELRPQL